MMRYFVHALAGVAVLGSTGLVVAACQHNDSTIFVQDVLAPQELTNGMQCVFTSQTSQATISSGVLDVDFLREYNAVYLVGNQMVPEVNSQQLQTETSTVTIQGAAVRITDSSGTQLTTFTRLAAATIYPSSGGVPSFAPISVTTIDQNTINTDPDIAAKVFAPMPFTQAGTVRLVTYVKFFGQTLGGRHVESGEFEFPVDVCRGCLIGFSGANTRQSCAVPNCLNAGLSSTTTVSSPCIPGQDLPVDCSLCIGIVPDCAGVPQPPNNPLCNIFADGG
jgi:hypothetical protein